MAERDGEATGPARHSTPMTGLRRQAITYPKTKPAYMKLSNTLVMARRAGRRLAGCGIG
jgi:hypothetical protein